LANSISSKVVFLGIFKNSKKTTHKENTKIRNGNTNLLLKMIFLNDVIILEQKNVL